MIAHPVLQVDVYGYRRLTSVLEWLGLHALSIFVLITSNLAIIAIQGFYWTSPEKNIVSINYRIFFTKKMVLVEVQKPVTPFFCCCTFLALQVHWIITRFVHTWHGRPVPVYWLSLWIFTSGQILWYPTSIIPFFVFLLMMLKIFDFQFYDFEHGVKKRVEKRELPLF